MLNQNVIGNGLEFLWESQHACTSELIGQDLVGREVRGRRP